MKGRVLIVAGSDSGGGAGIQADIKTVTALGAYAMTAVTALTAQNTTGVAAIFEAPPEFVAEQIAVVAEDIGVDAVKTGMMAGRAIIEAAAAALTAHAGDVPWVVDPVMVAKGGQSLLDGGRGGRPEIPARRPGRRRHPQCGRGRGPDRDRHSRARKHGGRGQGLA